MLGEHPWEAAAGQGGTKREQGGTGGTPAVSFCFLFFSRKMRFPQEGKWPPASVPHSRSPSARGKEGGNRALSTNCPGWHPQGAPKAPRQPLEVLL